MNMYIYGFLLIVFGTLMTQLFIAKTNGVMSFKKFQLKSWLYSTPAMVLYVAYWWHYGWAATIVTGCIATAVSYPQGVTLQRKIMSREIDIALFS